MNHWPKFLQLLALISVNSLTIFKGRALKNQITIVCHCWLLLGLTYRRLSKHALRCKTVLQLGLITPVGPIQFLIINLILLALYVSGTTLVILRVPIVVDQVVVYLLLNESEDDVVSQQLGYLMGVLGRVVFILNVEELFVKIQQNLAWVHVGTEVCDVFLVQKVYLVQEFLIHNEHAVIRALGFNWSFLRWTWGWSDHLKPLEFGSDGFKVHAIVLFKARL
jgi:hypothetical protein